jgi:hypothetical protein
MKASGPRAFFLGLVRCALALLTVVLAAATIAVVGAVETGPLEDDARWGEQFAHPVVTLRAL